MSSYTNVTIPDRFSTIDRLTKQVKDLQHENKYLSEQYDYVLRILENIPKAVMEYGYVEISSDDGKEKITLVAKTPSRDTMKGQSEK